MTSEILAKYEAVFVSSRPASNYDLIFSYLIGMVLDDLAQPRWYGSKDHELLAQSVLLRLGKGKSLTSNVERLFVPKSFTPILNLLRSGDPEFPMKVPLALDGLELEFFAHAA